MSVRLEFVKETLEEIQKYGEQVSQEVENELLASALTITRNAKANAPESQGHLRRSITYGKIGDLLFEVMVNADYAMYVEFGTRGKVRIPSGWESLAAQARGTGTIGTLTAKEAIFRWCEREGVDEQYWWPIYLSIMVEGMNPHPYLIPAVEDEKEAFEARIKKIIK